MASTEHGGGHIADNVAINVRHLRAGLGWSLQQLSRQLVAIGHPVLPTGLQRLETGGRRIDVDDLVALAMVLRVSPVTLMLPPRDSGHVALTGSIGADAADAWRWMRAIGPLDGEADPAAVVEHQERSLPLGQRHYDLKTPEGKRAWIKDHPDQLIKFLPDAGQGDE
jgi:transcriptional regulator with XRE-family HTH domain